ncbi:MAG TPA: uroporphyrinogen-III synthase [Acidimicrobiales bacterium]|jgi:uroporphyrinogen-III synthase|nr:uroporphyrinogen-III synthase [Acidimicrobiales bacterium]
MDHLVSLRPLDGFVVGITADRRWEEQAELLARRGATVMHGPTITTLYLASDENLRQATVAIIEDPPDYLVATTGIGMRAWLESAAAWGFTDALVSALRGTKIVARGPKAAAALQIGGLEAWQRSPNEQMGGLTEILLGEDLAGRRVAIQEYGVANPELEQLLGAVGASVVTIPVYRWRLPDDPDPARRLVKAVCEGQVDAVTFTSAPAVHNLFAVAAEMDQSEELRRAFNGPVAAACVGPVCASGAVAEGVADPITPNVGRLGLLVRLLGEHLGQRRRTMRLAGHKVVIQGGAVEVDGEVAQLSPKERSILGLLLRKPGAVVARNTFLGRIWGSTTADAHLLEVAVGRLRRRLGPAGAALQAIPGRGYRLDPDETS